MSLAINSSCILNVTFISKSVGSATGSIQLSDNASSSPQTISLSAAAGDFSIAAANGNSTSLTINAAYGDMGASALLGESSCSRDRILPACGNPRLGLVTELLAIDFLAMADAKDQNHGSHHDSGSRNPAVLFGGDACGFPVPPGIALPILTQGRPRAPFFWRTDG